MNNAEEIAEELFGDLERKKKLKEREDLIAEMSKRDFNQTRLFTLEQYQEQEKSAREEDYDYYTEYPSFEDLHDIIGDIKKGRKKRNGSQF